MERRKNAERRQSLKRTNDRVPLQLPIRVRAKIDDVQYEELTNTINVSQSGVYFASTKPYRKGISALVCLNYSESNPAINIEKKGTVVRIDSEPASSEAGIAIKLG